MRWNDDHLSQSRRYKRDFSLGDHDSFADSYLFGMSQDTMIFCLVRKFRFRGHQITRESVSGFVWLENLVLGVTRLQKNHFPGLFGKKI